MHTLRFALLAALVAASPALAQDDTPIEPGARALLFGVDLNSGLTSFGGATLGAKWHSSAERATRIGLTLQAFAQGGEDQDRQSALVAGNAVFLRYRRSRTPIYLYHGLGPTASLRLNRDAFGDQDRLNARVGVGVLGVVGVEWPVASAVSLTGEYGLTLEGTYERFSAEPDDADLFGVALQSRGGVLGVAVYF